MSLASLERMEPATGAMVHGVAVVPAWVWIGAGLLVLGAIGGNHLLQDPDTYWQIAVGQDILAHRALPVADVFSFTRIGMPWTSSSWLSQVLFAAGFSAAGWAGPVLLCAIAIAATFAQFVGMLSRRFEPTHAALLAMAALALCAHHFLARPHVLAMPVMLAWVCGLTAAADRRDAPSLWRLPLMTLWTNLHGGFLLGLMLVAPFALDALWSAEPARRLRLALRWILFGVAALAASCLTPYGWGSLLAALKILDLGTALALIPEWQGANFNGLSIFEVCLLAPLGAALLRGISLTPPRILLLLGLVHMALAHNRNFELYALLVPVVVATPVAMQLALPQRPRAARQFSAAPVAVVLLAVAMSGAIASRVAYRFTPDWTPMAAVQVLREHGVTRVFNDPSFGGYLITQGVPTFIDGRAELYGEDFILRVLDALALRNLDGLIGLLDAYKIDATLLSPSSPAVQALDRLGGWRRVHADAVCVVHMRTGQN